jgi:hypothetical protein
MQICVVSGKICEKDSCTKACIDGEILKVLLSYFPSYKAYDYRPFMKAKSMRKETYYG